MSKTMPYTFYFFQKFSIFVLVPRISLLEKTIDQADFAYKAFHSWFAWWADQTYDS